MDKAKVRKMAVSAAVVASMVFGAQLASAQQDKRIKDVVEEVNKSTQIAKNSQQQIDTIADATDKLFSEYKQLLKVNAGLEAYNTIKQRTVDRQNVIINDLEASIGRVDEIKRQITGIMLRMIVDLENFIKEDAPFQREARLERIANLREVLDSPLYNDPEKFRVIMQTYNTEVSFGRSINTYEGLNDAGQTVNFVRLGRVGFYFQDLEGKNSSVYNRATKSWDPLPASRNTSIRQLIRMAKKTVQFDLTILPIPAPAQ